ncbi:MAG: hypothetical protein K0Q91_2038 [Fibrobacteria bacterium]|jgi:type 1 glutamine amidotransferase|nr:hypothetical protein [Fibrobacteria bacterium]
MTTRIPFRIAALLGAAAAASSAAPVRVGIFTGFGATYGHTHIHTAANALRDILVNPAGSGLGSGLVMASAGFQVTRLGLPDSSSCRILNCPPDADRKAEFLAALDSLDVLVLNNNSLLEHIFDGAGREKIEAFARRKGVVSLHATLHMVGAWPSLDSLHGTTFNNHPVEQSGTVRLDPASSGDASWRFLNRGLPDTARFMDEWLFYTSTGAQLRARSGLKVSLNLKEDGINPGGLAPMGDHPLAWYRAFPQGGRFFYTALGHRAQNFTGTGSAATPEGTQFTRRHIYNAILWAAGVDSNGVVSVQPAARAPDFGFTARPDAGGLRVRFEDAVPRAVVVRALDGRRAARAVVRGEGLLAVPRGVYGVSVEGSEEAGARRVAVP